LQSLGVNKSSGSLDSKETLLTDLRGNRVTINTQEETKLRGASIAAVDSQGNDNSQLTLNTDTLLASGLNNRVDSKNKSLSINIGGNVEENTLNNVALDYSNDKSNQKTKTLATLGSGNINITNTDDSELKMLNRDIQDNEVDIYNIQSHKGLKVELDTRLLTEDGRKQIAEDLERTKRLGRAIADVATKESITIGDTFNHIDDVQKDLDVQKALSLRDNGKLIDILDDKSRSKYTQEERDYALNEYAQIYANAYNVNIQSAKSAIIAGKYGSTYTNQESSISNIFVDDVKNQGALDTANIMGHEVSHVRMNQGETRQRETTALQEEYADTFGEYSADGMEFSSSSNNNVNLNTKPSQSQAVRTTESVDTLVNNTKDYYTDKAKADSGDGQMDDSVIPGAAYTRWVALKGEVPIKELLKQENEQDSRIAQLTEEKLINQGKEVVEMAKNLPKTVMYLYDNPEEFKKLPDYIQKAIVEYVARLGDNAVDIGKGLVTNNPQAIEAQAQAESDLLVDLTTTLAGAGIGKLAVVGGKVVVKKLVKSVDIPKTNTKDMGFGDVKSPNLDVKIAKGQDVLLTSKDGLEVRLPSEGKFDNVIADGKTTHLFTIDETGLKVINENTSVGGNSIAKHTNLSDKAAFGGEVKFNTDGSVTVNPYSGRFGVGNSVNDIETLTKLDSTKKYFESLGYDVKVEFEPKTAGLINVESLSNIQNENLIRFTKKIPSNSKDTIKIIANKDNTITFEATSLGKVEGSKAVYKKTIDNDGKTISYQKETYNPDGNLVHNKDKFNVK
ncbi:MAG TPA: hypothetical protein VLZ29_02250, partial [Sulfurimonas sp.]|uniref:hypothetical protein n=1 Tax=Sulfurimonas sp. TaxID=2022749 RepID=UPI002D04D0A5